MVGGDTPVQWGSGGTTWSRVADERPGGGGLLVEEEKGSRSTRGGEDTMGVAPSPRWPFSVVISLVNCRRWGGQPLSGNLSVPHVKSTTKQKWFTTQDWTAREFDVGLGLSLPLQIVKIYANSGSSGPWNPSLLWLVSLPTLKPAMFHLGT
jgi:hypothetical protein